MNRRAPTVRQAVAVLERLPHEALADLAERLIDLLDVAEPDQDLEPDDHDACEAEDIAPYGDTLPGDPDDAEHNGDDELEEHGGAEEPDEVLTIRRLSRQRLVHLRAERDGFVSVWRHPNRRREQMREVSF